MKLLFGILERSYLHKTNESKRELPDVPAWDCPGLAALPVSNSVPTGARRGESLRERETEKGRGAQQKRRVASGGEIRQRGGEKYGKSSLILTCLHPCEITHVVPTLARCRIYFDFVPHRSTLKEVCSN